MNDETTDFNITDKEWLQFLGLEITSTSSYISLLQSIKTEHKTTTTALISIVSVFIIAGIGASTIPELFKIIIILFIFLCFISLLYRFDKRADDLFYNHIIRYQDLINNCQSIITQIFNGDLKTPKEIKQEFLKVTSNFSKNKIFKD